jgi:soluble lytic murein transglycosylase-like protein
MRRQAAFWSGAILCAVSPFAALGQDSEAGAFSFKRVKVGQITAGKRITVQIDPAEQARVIEGLGKGPRRAVVAPPLAALGPVVLPKTSARYDWFWQAVAPERDQVAGRFDLAMAQLSRGPEGVAVAAPRLQQMQALAARYGTEILKATIDTQVSPALVLAVMGIESGGQVKAQSRAGAMGLMQLMPATAARFGVSDATDPAQNIKGGVAYLDFLMRSFNRDPVMVLAAYNAGEGAVAANKGVPPFAETRDYVPKVLAAWQVAQGLCLTPPELVSDPCVFKVIAAAD